MALPDKSDLSADYGGPYTNARPVEDPTTDVDAVALNRALNDIAMATHTIERAWVAFNGTTYTSGTQSITVADHDALWGSGTAVKPTVVQTSPGVYVITWATTQTDQLGNSHTLNIRYPKQPVVTGVTAGFAQVVSKTANSITILAVNTSFSANSLDGDVIYVSWS